MYIKIKFGALVYEHTYKIIISASVFRGWRAGEKEETKRKIRKNKVWDCCKGGNRGLRGV